MRNILVTAISGNVSNGILKCLQGNGDNLYGCDVYDYPVGMDKVITYWKSDFAVSEEYIPNLLEKCKEYKITHLIPVNEIEIEVISNHREEFEKCGVKLIINSKAIVDTFLDKETTVKRLQTIDGVDVPRLFEEIPAEGNCQYIVKPRKSCGSKKIKVISSHEEWDLFENKETYVLQEYIDAPEEEYTVGVFSSGVETSVIAFRRKLENGYTAFVEYVKDERIVSLSKEIAESINLRGYINIQLRKKDNKYYVFEINPRISGTVYFREMLGFSDVKWWLNLVDGVTDYSYREKYTKAIGMRELFEKYVILE